VPRYEADVWITDRMPESVSDFGLGTEVHISEEELACQGGGWRGSLTFVGGYNILNTPVEETAGEGAEVQVRGEEGSCLGPELCGCCFGLFRTWRCRFRLR
jgi:hypothetical protein